MSVAVHPMPWGWLKLEEQGGFLLRVQYLCPEEKPEISAAPSSSVLRQTCSQLDEYFAGKRQSFDLPLAPQGTDFQRRVWAELCLIDRGRTRSYGEVARAIGSPGGARAVGMACNRNPLLIVVPCHRVVGADGGLTGFGAGLFLKRRLLELEGVLLS